jgi:hypothetical protein
MVVRFNIYNYRSYRISCFSFRRRKKLIINTELKECETCKRHFVKLDIHHINGNHKDNREENRINICRSCHTSIHKNVSCRKNREYNLLQEDEDKNTNERLYDLRVVLHKSKYGNLNFIPNDNITKIAKFNKYMNKIVKREIEALKDVKEIVIPYG